MTYEEIPIVIENERTSDVLGEGGVETFGSTMIAAGQEVQDMGEEQEQMGRDLDRAQAQKIGIGAMGIGARIALFGSRRDKRLAELKGVRM